MEIKTLEVKNLSHYARGSEETPCYNATVYINGKKAIEISNDGRGGMDYQHSYPDFGDGREGIVQKANEWCVKTFGQESFKFMSGGKEETCTYDIDLEHYCHKVLYDWLDTNLPSLLEDVGYKIDWNDDEERNNYHAFRNRVYQLIDKYYGEST